MHAHKYTTVLSNFISLQFHFNRKVISCCLFLAHAIDKASYKYTNQTLVSSPSVRPDTVRFCLRDPTTVCFGIVFI